MLFSRDDWTSSRYLSIPSGPFLLPPTSINSSEVNSSLIENTNTSIANQSAPTEQELTIGNTTTSIPTNIANQSEVIEELSIRDIRQHRMELLAGINNTINSLPNSAFNQLQEVEKLKDSLILETQNETGSLADLLQSDKLEEAICTIK